MKTIKNTILLVSAFLLFTGCTMTKVQTPDGMSFTSYRFADWTKIGKLEAGMGTNSIVLEGYDSDRQTAAVEAMKVAQQAMDLAAKSQGVP